jgi:hypothetical protein
MEQVTYHRGVKDMDSQYTNCLQISGFLNNTLKRNLIKRSGIWAQGHPEKRDGVCCRDGHINDGDQGIPILFKKMKF